MARAAYILIHILAIVFLVKCDQPPTNCNSNTQPEPENPTNVGVCSNGNDVIVVLDLARAFANRGNSRFGFTIFCSTVSRIVPLTNTLTSSQLYFKILNANYLQQSKSIDLAIFSAVEEFTASPSTVPKNLVVITVGRRSDYNEFTSYAAQIAAAKGIRTFAVGIGIYGVDIGELYDIVNDNDNRVFTVRAISGYSNPSCQYYL